MQIDYSSYVTPTFVRELFEGAILDEENKGWYITLCGKILTIDGKVFFNSREQAMKAFYNSYNWRAKHKLYDVTHPEPNGRYHYWSDPDRTIMWRAFKRKLESEYGFQILHA